MVKEGRVEVYDGVVKRGMMCSVLNEVVREVMLKCPIEFKCSLVSYGEKKKIFRLKVMKLWTP